MAPGPKKKSFHTPRNPKNNQIFKNDKNISERNDEANENKDKSSNLTDSCTSESKKYSKRSIESNWDKYGEPLNDQHADSMRGNDFEVLLSYSGGSGSQLKLQDEKEWEEDCVNVKDISLNFQDIINALKCIPFHDRMNIKNIFDENHITNFVSCAEKWKMCYKPQANSPDIESESLKPSFDPVINIVEEPNSLEPEEDITVKTFVVQDKTENIINSLASGLTFKKISQEKLEVEEKKPEASNDLDFLLSLNIPSRKSASNNNNAETQQNSNVDDWLDSILDD